MLKTKAGKRVNSTKDLSMNRRLLKVFGGKDQNGSVKIGFPANSSETNSKDDEGVTALFKATVNNYGLGVPKRPFMDVSFQKNVKNYIAFIRKNIEKLDSEKLLNQIGNMGVGDVRKTIVDFKSPPNSDATIKRKGENNPLIESSHMVGAVTYEVVGK